MLLCSYLYLSFNPLKPNAGLSGPPWLLFYRGSIQTVWAFTKACAPKWESSRP
jgi:hypothetical protein